MLTTGDYTRDGILQIVDTSQSAICAPLRVTIAEQIGMRSFSELGKNGRANMLARARRLAKKTTDWQGVRASVVREFSDRAQSFVTIEIRPLDHVGIGGFGYCVECGKKPGQLAESCPRKW